MSAIAFSVVNSRAASFAAARQVITDQVNDFILDKKLDKKTLAMYSAAAGVSAFLATTVLGHVTGHSKVMEEVEEKFFANHVDEELCSLLEKRDVLALIVAVGSQILGSIGGKIFIDNTTDKSLSWNDVRVLKTAEIIESLVLKEAVKALIL